MRAKFCPHDQPSFPFLKLIPLRQPWPERPYVPSRLEKSLEEKVNQYGELWYTDSGGFLLKTICFLSFLFFYLILKKNVLLSGFLFYKINF